MTKHPITSEWEIADWLDDYFGRHRYGVAFPDGQVFPADGRAWETRQECGEITTPDGTPVEGETP